MNFAYAFLLVKYISEQEEPHRFLVLGFKGIRQDLSIHFKSICKGDLLIPAGKLEEISNLRKTFSPCLIVLDWEDVGKYASWTTSFKILTESPLKVIESVRHDVYDPTDVSMWLLERDDILRQVMGVISEKLGISFKPRSFGTLKYLFAAVRKSMERSRSFGEWFHPQKIVKALTSILQLQGSTSHANVTVGHFLRNIGMEPSSEFDEIPFFGNQTIQEESLKNYFRRYQEVLRCYLNAPFEKGAGRLRKTLSTLGLNLLRHLLVSAAEKEIGKRKRGKWTAYFLEFEQGKRDKRTRKRKYDINIYGTTILSRSPVSGLPTRIQFVLERSKDFGGDNILPKLFQNELKALLTKCHKKFGGLKFEIATIKMLGSNTLILELIMEKNGLVTVDPYIKGLKAPIRKANNLLSKLGVE